MFWFSSFGDPGTGSATGDVELPMIVVKVPPRRIRQTLVVSSSHCSCTYSKSPRDAMPQHWIRVTQNEQDTILWTSNSPFRKVCPAHIETGPALVTLVGRKRKSLVLNSLAPPPTKGRKPAHGGIYLTYDTTNNKRDGPIVYVDCELQVRSGCKFDPKSAPCMPRPLGWCQSDSATEFANLFVANVLNPLSTVVCYFAADLQGLQHVSSLLARQATRPRTHTLPHSALPHILVVVETGSDTFDPIIAQAKLQQEILDSMKQCKQYSGDTVLEEDVHSAFYSVQVLGLQKCWSDQTRQTVIRRRISSLSQEGYWRRRIGRYHFTAQHIDALADGLLQNFCQEKACFNFIRSSMPAGFLYRDLDMHLDEMLSLIPNQSWLWHFVIPLIGSALLLASYPPGSHGMLSLQNTHQFAYLGTEFPPSAIFEEFFGSRCKKAIQRYTADLIMQRKFLTDVQRSLSQGLSQLETNPELYSALHQHRQCLQTLRSNFLRLKSFKSCLSCLMSMPEKVFDCGHAICNLCIRRLGQRARNEKHTFRITECVLCGQTQSKATFSLIPPTAGIRILCIDGGGIRGVIPLTFLQFMEKELSFIGCALQEHFDYVCGTSAGESQSFSSNFLV